MEAINGCIHVVMVDGKIGGTVRDITRRPVAAALVLSASSPRCVGVVISIRCGTWSVALHNKETGSRGPYRRRAHVLGIPDASGRLPPAVVEANTETEHAAEVCMAALQHGGFVLAEQPARRRVGTTATPDLAIPGCEDSVHMFDHPAWQLVAREGGGAEITWDQCMFADEPEKAARKSTVWLATPPILQPIRAYFDGRTCNHAGGTHVKLAGLDDDGQWMTKRAETYSPATNRILARCISVARGGERAYVTGVIQGRHLNRKSVTHPFIHQSFNHAEARVLRHLPEALSDIPAWWKDIIEDTPCDACLRANAPQVGPHGHLPQDEGLLFMDIWHTSVGEIITNYKITLGVVHAATGFKKSIRMRYKAQAPEALTVILAYFASVGRPITWIHTDGAGELKGTGMLPVARERQIRFTTTVRGVSRMNRQEPQWRVYARMVRSALAQARLPYAFYGWAWDHIEEGSALTPSRSPPHDCPLGRLINGRPAGSHRRPFWCLCYVRVAPTHPGGGLVNKLAEQGVRAIHLGYGGGQAGSFEGLSSHRSQAGYYCYLPDTTGRGRVVCSDSVRFIAPAVFPGLQRTAGGGYAIPSKNVPSQPDHEAGGDGDQDSAELYDIREDKDLERMEPPEGEDALFEVFEGFPRDCEDASKTADERNQHDYDNRSDLTPTAYKEPSKSDRDFHPPVEEAKETTRERWIVPASMWPDYNCNENDGLGWTVDVINRRGKYSRVKYVGTADDGDKYENQWVETSRLQRNPQQDDKVEGACTRDNLATHPLEPEGEGELTPNHNTIPPEGQEEPYREPTRPERNRRPPERYEAGTAYALAGMPGMSSDAGIHGYDPKSPRMDLSALALHVTAWVEANLAPHEMNEFQRLKESERRAAALVADHVKSSQRVRGGLTSGDDG